MDYQALYRKYRPQRFDEVVGQDHVVKTLAREVVEGRIAHAYLFAGPRGTGKTTSARLLAKALNCTNRGDDGEPCNTCDSCTGITEGTSLDVIELDAASHNKVEDIREMRVNVGTVAAAGGARRVYILDEAHMLSRAAGNALLKTLEEPPEHVIFVLATTEPYKLLDTIRSRAQRFDFHPIPVEILIDYLGVIAEREGFTAGQDGLSMVASHARGSVRDAMSLLEQVASLGSGTVEAAMVARALGLADKDAFGALATAVAEQDAPAALGLVSQLAAQGADLRRFVAEALSFFRGVFLAQYAPNLEEVADEPLGVLEEWRRVATQLEPADVLRSVDQLGEALLHLRQGREERLVVELALLRLTRPETAIDASGLDARVSRLESRVRDLLSGAVVAPAAAPAPAPEPVAPDAPFTDDVPKASAAAPVEAAVEVEAEPEPESPVTEEPDDAADEPIDESQAPPEPEELDLRTVESAWPAVVARIRDQAGPRRHALLKEASPAGVDGRTVTFALPAHLPFHLEQLKADGELHQIVASTAAEVIGGAVDIRFVAADGDGDATGSTPPEPPRAPDKDDLLEAGDDGAEDPASIVVDMLGGEVVSE
ncbi:MAG: DNA polymerase III subunit gamma/tau [Acidimicrobiia bacterium]|nr:DNA polymerase III subunit gamma/tau [Acidimicrobiia bacterium]